MGRLGVHVGVVRPHGPRTGALDLLASSSRSIILIVVALLPDQAAADAARDAVLTGGPPGAAGAVRRPPPFARTGRAARRAARPVSFDPRRAADRRAPRLACYRMSLQLPV